MLTVAPPDAVELRCNATFEALMWALSRPGRRCDMPEAGLAAVVDTLIDLECSVFADEPRLRDQALASGAIVRDEPSSADYVFLASLEGAETQLVNLRCGSALYPDDGATLIAEVKHGMGQRVRLSGPGVDGSVQLELGISPSFWAMRDVMCSYPEGFDMFLVDGRSIIGIPRSTLVEVL